MIKSLTPVSFAWKQNNQFDFGLVAEEVVEVEPLLITSNGRGDVEGVKYDRIGVVLVNAVQEQQQQIEEQQQEIARQKALITNQKVTLEAQEERLLKQQAEIDAIKRLVCANNLTADICILSKQSKKEN